MTLADAIKALGKIEDRIKAGYNALIRAGTIVTRIVIGDEGRVSSIDFNHKLEKDMYYSPGSEIKTPACAQQFEIYESWSTGETEATPSETESLDMLRSFEKDDVIICVDFREVLTIPNCLDASEVYKCEACGETHCRSDQSEMDEVWMESRGLDPDDWRDYCDDCRHEWQADSLASVAYEDAAYGYDY